jgi:8-oxo-dGTP diphosphatase
LETLSQIPVDEVANVPKAPTIAMTIKDTISPYSIAVAPDWHLTMPRIRSNIIGSIFLVGCERIPFFHKKLNKNFQSRAQMKNNPTIASSTLIVVAAALVRDDGMILLQKRPEGRSMAGLWEFPGGKQEPEESAEAALLRELYEELAISVSVADLTPLCFASAAIGERPLLLLLFACRAWNGTPTGAEGQELGWFSLDDMQHLPMPPADLPLLDLLKMLL